MTTLLNALTASQQRAFDAFLAANSAKFFRFELLDAGAVMDVIGDDNIKRPQMRFASRCLSGETTFPSTEGQDVHFVYSKRTQRIKQNGQDVVEPVPEPIWFEADRMGNIEVPRNAAAFLVRMLFSNECENGINPAKAESLQGYVYRLIQPEKTAAELSQARAFIRKVGAMIDENTPEENVQIAKRLQVSLRLDFNFNAGPDALREALIDATASHSHAVYAATSDSSDKALALIDQATKAGLIRFKHETREWVYEATGQVLQVIPTGDHAEGLAAWLVDTQGDSARRALKKQLEDAATTKPDKVKGIKIAEGEPVPEGYVKGALGYYYPKGQAK